MDLEEEGQQEEYKEEAVTYTNNLIRYPIQLIISKWEVVCHLYLQHLRILLSRLNIIINSKHHHTTNHYSNYTTHVCYPLPSPR